MIQRYSTGLEFSNEVLLGLYLSDRDPVACVCKVQGSAFSNTLPHKTKTKRKKSSPLTLPQSLPRNYKITLLSLVELPTIYDAPL